MKKSTRLRKLFKQPGVVRIVGAHDGLSAKLVERNKFDGVWASGFEIATSYAVPDASILTMSQYLERAVEINDAVSIPVIADCDTGFGNSNNVIHMVHKYESAGIAAVCIEDKKFPKINSLLFKGRQELAPIGEFVGKIMAAKNAQKCDSFMVIARVEALIAGWGQEEALKRAREYAEAGADAILIHSKAQSPQPIIEFTKAWDKTVPLVIVPTTYPSINFDALEPLGIKMVIYANQGLRAAIKAINSILYQIYKQKTTIGVEEKIASLEEAFALQGMPQLKNRERKYLRSGVESIGVIIPAAGAPKNQESLDHLLQDRPVCMLDINGKPLLERNVERLRQAGCGDISIITGYQSDKIIIEGVETIYNSNYQDKHILHSIMLAGEKLKGRILIAYSDILFDKHLISRLLETEGDIILAVDATYKRTHQRNKKLDLTITERKPFLKKRAVTSPGLNRILKIGSTIPDKEGDYEFIGLVCLSPRGSGLFKEAYRKAKKKYSKSKKFHEADSFDHASFEDMIQEIIDLGHPVSALEVSEGWMEIHSFSDYRNACLLTRTG